MDHRRPSDSASELTRWMGLADANTAGNVHGGVIMKLCDEVAGIAAIRHCGGRVVTAGMDRMAFLHPVFVGQLVTVRATVDAAWRTSMEVGVRVEDSRHPVAKSPTAAQPLEYARPARTDSYRESRHGRDEILEAIVRGRSAG